ncbi:uncharacterized protein JCM6883_002438 [Sporobolomyces salmoneus]|uniref:uncharacterized protein n=1 Tax=Sporobolomyces salmoneus TaxID=183962 RepID=UPI00317C3216
MLIPTRTAVFRPATFRRTLDRRTFASSNLVSFPRSRPTSTARVEAVDETEPELPRDILSHKLQTIPFQLPPSKALDISYTAAASTFGVSVVFAHLLSRFCKKWFGISPAVLDAGIVERAFKMVLLPVWKVDLVMRGKALLEDTELDLNISALDSSLPGFRLSPLDELPLSAPFDPDLSLPFSPSSHLTQYETPVTVLPFTHHPLSLLSKIASLPRTIAQTDGIGLTPRNFKEVLFATYPIYMPIYLGEFELRNDPEGKRVTTVQFGTSESPAFSVYPQFLQPPQWLPQSDSISLSISGRPTQPLSSPQPPANGGPSLLKQLEPRLTALLSKLQEKRRAGNEEGLITDRIEEGARIEELVEGNERVMGFSDWVEQNQEYVEASSKLENVEAMLEQVENMPENVKSLLISSSSMPKFQDRDSLLKDVTDQVGKAREEVERLKPEWIEEARRVKE